MPAKLAPIFLKGGASQRIRPLTPNREELALDLLSFLRSRGIPVASSCSGEGKCGKCVFNDSLLCCRKKVKDFLGKTVEFGYM